MYDKTAARHGLKKMPFLLEGVGGRAEYNIEDGIHPNPAGHRIIAENVDRFLTEEGLLE